MTPVQIPNQRIEKKRNFKLVKFTGIVVLMLALIKAAFTIWTPQPSIWALQMLASKNNPENFGSHPSDLPVLMKQTRVLSDISYPSKYQENKLDLYLPQTDSKPLPVIIFIHGGGFISGDKYMPADYSRALASKGFAVVSMNYELAPGATLFDQTKQVGEVLSYLQQLAQKYPLDPSQVILAGSSAGAFLAGKFSLIQTNSEYANLVGVPQSVSTNTIKGLLLYSAPYDITAFQHSDLKPVQQFIIKRMGWGILGDKNWMDNPKFDVLNLSKYITKDFPPAFVTDGNTNSFETQARTFVATLQEKDVPVTSLFFDPNEIKAGHGYQFDMASPASILSLKQTNEFLKGITSSN
ncbi:alpha/beta hydrolase [Bacillus toyonensis]|uniref:Acetylesterase n=3 Tax=Bacillaceae TaxID=186817 RepID=A0AB36SDU2_9BACI|nr:alpha/beta hydrolase [Bacillus toyonensis]PEB20726.1 acetylesterase [Bacillus toyonensis]PEE79423.1 acetylesterase [Bacillus toyonensis]PEL34969.1 acetylesterase [Bacillus toyonensis]PEN45092.1 acetylesterase [Bacillus toyonensis]PFY82555.1 acetylesterase [Bacillus toyonensis]